MVMDVLKIPQTGEVKVRCCPQVVTQVETTRSVWSETGKGCIKSSPDTFPGLPGIKDDEYWRLVSVGRGGGVEN